MIPSGVGSLAGDLEDSESGEEEISHHQLSRGCIFVDALLAVFAYCFVIDGRIERSSPR